MRRFRNRPVLAPHAQLIRVPVATASVRVGMVYTTPHQVLARNGQAYPVVSVCGTTLLNNYALTRLGASVVLWSGPAELRRY